MADVPSRQGRRGVELARYDTRANLLDELRGLLEFLNGAGVEYAVCGGVAVAIHGYPRFTKDIDLQEFAHVDHLLGPNEEGRRG